MRHGSRVLATLIGLAASVPCACAEQTPPPLEQLKVGVPMPDFALKDAAGKEWKFSSLKGKAVAVTFGFITCQCGRDTLKDLQKLHTRFGSRGFQVLHVNMEPEMLAADPKFLAKFAKANKITYPLLADTGLAVSSRFEMPGMPFLVLVDKDGYVRFTFIGHPPGYLDVVADEISKCLPPPPKPAAEARS